MYLQWNNWGLGRNISGVCVFDNVVRVMNIASCYGIHGVIRGEKCALRQEQNTLLAYLCGGEMRRQTCARSRSSSIVSFCYEQG